jgi:hypothetical protein
MSCDSCFYVRNHWPCNILASWQSPCLLERRRISMVKHNHYKYTLVFVPFRFWRLYFKHRQNFQSRKIVSQPENMPKSHEIVNPSRQSMYRKQLQFFSYFYVNEQGNLCDCKLWRVLVSSVEVQNAVSCFSFWVQIGFEEESSKWRHSTGIDFAPTPTSSCLKITLLPKVTTPEGTTEKTEAADTGLTLQTNHLPHMWFCTYEMFLSVNIQVVNDERGSLKDYLSTLETFQLPF